MQVPGGTDEA